MKIRGNCRFVLWINQSLFLLIFIFHLKKLNFWIASLFYWLFFGFSLFIFILKRTKSFLSLQVKLCRLNSSLCFQQEICNALVMWFILWGFLRFSSFMNNLLRLLFFFIHSDLWSWIFNFLLHLHWLKNSMINAFDFSIRCLLMQHLSRNNLLSLLIRSFWRRQFFWY